MTDVPSNLIPTRITQLPLAPVADENSLMMIVYQGNNYQIRVGDLLSVAGVPITRQVIAGTGMAGGGQLSSNVTLSIAPGGVGSTELANSGVTPGTYGNSLNIPRITIDSKGRVTAATTESFPAPGLGTVTSVGLSLPAGFSVSGSPVTTSGTLTAAWVNQLQNRFLASPDSVSGTPTFRTIVASDIPTLNQNTTGQAGSIANSVTFNTSSGVAPGTSFNGSVARIVDYSTVGAPKADGTGASGIWNIAISGNAATATLATSATNVAGGAANRIVYQTGAGATAFVAAPTVANTYLEWSGSAYQWSANPLGTVTSVDVSGGTTGLTTSGGPVTTSGTITIAGTLAVANGGTGATDAGTARSNLGAAASGANSDITSMSGVTGGISSPDFIQFDATVSPLPTDATGKLYYNNDDQFSTLAFQMNGAVVQKIGEEQYFRVKCSSAVTKGQVVMFTGTLGASGALTAAPATGLAADQSNYILGVAAESGATNGWIFVTYFGEVKGLNTTGGAESWVDGTILYYNPAVTGGLTKNKPNTPNAITIVAAVVHANASNGILFIRPTYGSVLGGTDGNVQFGTLSNGDVIVYDGTDLRWENRAQSTLAVGSATNLAGGTASQIPYQTGAGATAFIANGTAGQVLVSAGTSAPTWAGINGGTF